MHQQTRAGKKEPPCTTSRTAVALYVPETLVPEIIEISTPPPSQLTMCCSYKSMVLIATAVSWDCTTSRAEKNCISSSRRLVLPEKPSLLVKSALSKYYFPMNCTRRISCSKNTRTLLWVLVYSENNTLKDSVQRWEHLEALQHKNRCWFSLTLAAF